jgi:tyrosyl-tRNA synthetase
MEINNDPKKIDEVLTRKVEKILPSKEGLKKLMRKRKIRLYLGIDPTSPQLHLGHAIPLRKLREFQELGHEVILLFGTFTALIGDPSGRDEKRKPLTPSQVEKNMATYREQVSKILDLSKVEIKCNGDWLSKLNFSEIINLSSHFTVSRLLERDMFQRRLKKGGEVWLNELLYPLMQGYDSVAMNVDLEVGASDQLFNMLVGRKLQRIYNKREKFILTTPMLVGLDGRKMSKTYQNTVNITDPPNEMYGKLMSLRDELIIDYFKLCTDLPTKEILEMEKELKRRKINPKEAKKKLAREIVKIYHGEKAAESAEEEFERVFEEKKLPKKISKIAIAEKRINILDLLVKTKMVPSKSEAKRLILQKAVEINGVLKEDWREVLEIKKEMVIKVGKRKFLKIIPH